MAIAERAADRLAPILDEVALAIGRLGISEGDAKSSKALLRVELEEEVKRIVQVYWTGFEADIPGRSIGLHLEVAQPTVHWAEGYLSPTYRNWIFCFHERPDGDIQLAYYQDLGSWQEAIKSFFDLAAWYVLTATGLTWDDVSYQASEDVGWTDHHRARTGPSTSAAVQESLKKSTIIWLKWQSPTGEMTMPVWFVNDKGRLYVLSGERQQTIPGAESLRECTVILRWKGKNAQVAEIPASVRVIPHGPEWDEVAEKIAEKRLNIPGLPEDTARRWRDECHILELTLRN
jgi:hypothetical protein